MKQEKNAATDLKTPKSIIHSMKKEIDQELSEKDLDRVKTKLRGKIVELRAAQKVVANIEREMCLLEFQLEQDLK